MSKINFYFIHLNPCLIDFSEDKSKIIKDVFKSYKEKIDKRATLGEVRLFSFSPRNNESYSEILECYMPLMKSPSVLVCYSIYDLAPKYSSAYSRIEYALLSDKIKTIYFYNYNKTEDVKSYMNVIKRVFRYSSELYPDSQDLIKRPRNLLKVDDLINRIMEFRECSPPVIYEDLSRITGINDSTLRRKGRSYDSSNTIGEKINKEQKEELEELMEDFIYEKLDDYSSMEETFIP